MPAPLSVIARPTVVTHRAAAKIEAVIGRTRRSAVGEASANSNGRVIGQVDGRPTGVIDGTAIKRRLLVEPIAPALLIFSVPPVRVVAPL